MKTLYNLAALFLVVLDLIFGCVFIASLFKGSGVTILSLGVVVAALTYGAYKLNQKAKPDVPSSITKVERDAEGHVTVTIDGEAALKKAMKSSRKYDWKLRDQFYPTPGPWDYHEQEYPMMLGENYRVTYLTRAGGQHTVDCDVADMISRNFLITKVVMPDTGDPDYIGIPLKEIVSLYDKATDETITEDIAGYIRKQNKRENAKYRHR